MKDRTFITEQILPYPRDAVFAFFSAPRNLEGITPKWLRFRMVDASTPEPGEGTIYTYRLRIHGVPCRWVSRIEEWRTGERFVDVQLAGPYSVWHHTHEFEDHEGGTLIRDRVRYRLPFGWLGDRLLGRFVTTDVARIFAHRARRTAELLGTLAPRN